jgi:hypothetical protein
LLPQRGLDFGVGHVIGKAGDRAVRKFDVWHCPRTRR